MNRKMTNFLLKSRHYSRTSENQKQRRQIAFNEITIILTGDFLIATTEARRQWNNINELEQG